ncbi:hypothetical protein J14TS5_42830 [Paenibacillus lautus]|nr:hypothetical protein J14TS5_42830 [Paenibacillus lautus]
MRLVSDWVSALYVMMKRYHYLVYNGRAIMNLSYGYRERRKEDEHENGSIIAKKHPRKSRNLIAVYRTLYPIDSGKGA